jgi:adenosylmethionine-8-amino-7-oxononanoate aminotransferase
MLGHPRVQDPRVKGTSLALDLVSDGLKGYRSGIAQQAREFFIERGVLLRPLGDVLYFMPPYCFSDDELSRVHVAIEEFVGRL